MMEKLKVKAQQDAWKIINGSYSINNQRLVKSETYILTYINQHSHILIIVKINGQMIQPLLSNIVSCIIHQDLPCPVHISMLLVLIPTCPSVVFLHGLPVVNPQSSLLSVGW